MPDDTFSPQDQQNLVAVALTLVRKYAGTVAIAAVMWVGNWGKGYLDDLNERANKAAELALAAKNSVEVNQTITTLEIDNLKQRMLRAESQIDTLTAP